MAGKHGAILHDGRVEVEPHEALRLSLGYGKTPLFASVRDLPVETLAVPELSLVARAFSPGRDVGAEAHLAHPALPVEAWIRAGNGSGAANGNDNPALAGEARLDLSFGRCRAGAERDAPWGLRLGVGGHLEDAFDRAGISGSTTPGFVFWRSPTVSGPLRLGEAHLLAQAGPVQLLAEGAMASEGREKDDDGNPETPRVALDPVRSSGLAAELAWMLTGQRRQAGEWPVEGERPALELAARGQRIWLGRGSEDVEDGGGAGVEGALRLWHEAGLGGALHGGWTRYDTPPLEAPEAETSVFVGARLLARM